MVLLRSGLVLFVSVTILASLIVNGVFFGQAAVQGWSPNPNYLLWHTQIIAIITGPTTVLLMLLAWRGRRRPSLDGTIITAILLFAICSCLYMGARNSDDPISYSYAGIFWAFCFAGLASIIPAHLFACFALRRTLLLRGLVPQKTELKAWLDQRP